MSEFQHRKRRNLLVLLPLALSACGGGGFSARMQDAGGVANPSECVPYARAHSGLALYDAAWRWWDEADGIYPRSSQPSVGAVLVFRRTARLPDGHVSVVAQILSPREIQVDQANWVHGWISHDEVVDVSEANDWSLVRVWWQPTNTLGATFYPTYGFVGPAALANRSLQPAAMLAICAGSAAG